MIDVLGFTTGVLVKEKEPSASDGLSARTICALRLKPDKKKDSKLYVFGSGFAGFLQLKFKQLKTHFSRLAGAQNNKWRWIF